MSALWFSHYLQDVYDYFFYAFGVKNAVLKISVDIFALFLNIFIILWSKIHKNFYPIGSILIIEISPTNHLLKTGVRKLVFMNRAWNLESVVFWG